MLLLSVSALVVVIGLMLIIASSRGTQNCTPENIESLVRNVDIPAFLNLIATNNDKFLKQHLSPSTFRRLRRKRTLATLAYLEQLATATKSLIQIGEAARRSPDPNLARSGIRLANTAVRTRIMILGAYLECLSLLVFPKMEGFLRPTLISHYRDMHERFGLLYSLTQPVMIKAKVRS